jgi:hypothetical protein
LASKLIYVNPTMMLLLSLMEEYDHGPGSWLRDLAIFNIAIDSNLGVQNR